MSNYYFSVEREVPIFESVDNNEIGAVMLHIEGTVTYTEGDYWTPSDTEYNFSSVTFADDCVLDGQQFVAGQLVPEKFWTDYAEDKYFLNKLDID